MNPMLSKDPFSKAFKHFSHHDPNYKKMKNLISQWITDGMNKGPIKKTKKSAKGL